ncbi:MAG TPA: protein kinase, partial [Labilithrix sp.]
QVLSGLTAAHQVAIIHRDIKPGNIFLQNTLAVRDLAKVVDFGLAKLVADATQTMPAVTRNGQILGTLAYMAPEQASGAPLDARVDIYAVGATLFHCLSGLRPYEVVELGRGKTSVATHAPWIDRTLAAIIDKAIEKRPEDRWQSAEQMAQALAPYAARPSMPNSAPRTSGPTTSGPMTAGPPSPYDPTVLPPTFSGGAPMTVPGVPPTVAATATEVPPQAGRPREAPMMPPGYLGFNAVAPSAVPGPGYGPPPPHVSYPPHGYPPPQPGRSGMHPAVWVLLAFVVIGMLAPFALSSITIFQARNAADDARLKAEQNFLATATLPQCPRPDTCTEQKQDHGVTYPLCTNKTPNLNPFKQSDFLVVSTKDGARLAIVMTPPSGSSVDVQLVMVGTRDNVDASKVVGRVCRPGRAPSTSQAF